MNRIKINRVNHGVTVIYNDVFDNEHISWTAKGIYAYIACHGVCYRDEIIQNNKTSEKEMERATKELVEFGYLKEIDGGYELNV